jgi:hypothetical protein
VRRDDTERSHRAIVFPQGQRPKRKPFFVLRNLTAIFPGLPFACRVDLTAYQMNGKTKRKELTRNRVTETRTIAQSLWLLELAGLPALRAEE